MWPITPMKRPVTAPPRPQFWPGPSQRPDLIQWPEVPTQWRSGKESWWPLRLLMPNLKVNVMFWTKYRVVFIYLFGYFNKELWCTLYNYMTNSGNISVYNIWYQIKVKIRYGIVNVHLLGWLELYKFLEPPCSSKFSNYPSLWIAPSNTEHCWQGRNEKEDKIENHPFCRVESIFSCRRCSLTSLTLSK